MVVRIFFASLKDNSFVLAIHNFGKVRDAMNANK
jgi:hypothetical protein